MHEYGAVSGEKSRQNDCDIFGFNSEGVENCLKVRVTVLT
jgi:hypothetical protein